MCQKVPSMCISEGVWYYNKTKNSFFFFLDFILKPHNSEVQRIEKYYKLPTRGGFERFAHARLRILVEINCTRVKPVENG